MTLAEKRERKNAKQRERYANDVQYRETMLAKQREYDKTTERCNHTLGRMNDDAALLRRAADYLEEHS